MRGQLLSTARLLALLPFALSSLAPLARAELRLPSVVSDGMVLQREAEVPLWGWADAGATVLVLPSWLDAPVRATAGEDGRWMARVATPAAGGPHQITVTEGAETLTVEDILIGEVWLCSGQSNMEWELYKTIEAAREAGTLPEATTSLARPSIRFFDVPRTFAGTPADDVTARWAAAEGEAALSCSAVAYYFGCRLRDELQVPIGLVVSSWGGTTAQAWTGTETVSQFPDHARSLERVRSADPSEQAERVRAFWSAVDDKAWWTRRFSAEAFDDAGWDVHVQPASFEEGPVGPHDGVVWFRRTIDVPAEWAGKDVELAMPPIDDADETFWNGASVGTTVEPGGWSKPRRYVVPGANVIAGPTTIAIRVVDTGGPGGFGGDGSAGLRATCDDAMIDLSGEWRVRKGSSASSLPPLPMPVAVDHRTPAGLFNGMIAPLVPYSVRGVIWYQGESNRSRAEEYRALFPAMIVDWRSRWEDLGLPFYFVQLAPYEYGRSDVGGKTAIVREAQADVVTGLPATGMALTADIGNPRDIHPVNKWDVGDRLARLAFRDLYGMPDVVAEGPTFKSAEREGEALRVRFDHVGGGLAVRGDGLAHFEIAAATGDYVPATATIADDGESVLLRADGVSAPTRARYLWDDAAEATLMGDAGLPAAPFRSR
ncbi:MAG: sialate O-acetylesterase [Planctomycetota bacterium]